MIDGEMSLEAHLQELRGRLIVVLGVVGGLFIVGYFAAKPILYWLIAHSLVHRLVVIGVTEAFFGVVRIDVVASLAVASPVILYEAAAFVFPGLTSSERRLVRWSLIPAWFLFFAGASLGFFGFVPVVLRIMLSFTGHGIRSLWTLSNYLSFVLDLSVPLGFVAELPLFAGLLSYAGILPPSLFARYRRQAIFAAFFVAAALAPPSALSMLLMAGPVYGIYELSHLVARIVYRPPPSSHLGDGSQVQANSY